MHPTPFSWQGSVPLAGVDGELAVMVNLTQGIEFPGLGPGERLPDCGPILDLPLLGEVAKVYAYRLNPRGLKAFLSKVQRTNYCLTLVRGGHRYLFRLPGDQALRDEAMNRWRAALDDLDRAYRNADLEGLAEGPLVRTAVEFLSAEAPILRERHRYLAEVVAEVGGQLHFLHGPEDPRAHQLRVRLPARPGDEVALAVRVGGVEREVFADRVVDEEGRGVKGLSVRLDLPRGEGRKARGVKARTNAEGWAELPPVTLDSVRALRLSCRDLEATLHLRYGRVEEVWMDAPTPPLPVGVRPMAQAGDQLIADLERFWDADFGALRDAAAGQRVELAFAMLEPFWFLPDPPPWVEALKDEARRRYSRRGAALRREDPPGAYLFGGTSARGLRSWLAERQAELDGEDWNVWTQDQARVLQQVAVALGARPNKGLATDLTRYAEALAARVEAQVEPTWRWQAFRRPIKTFKANPDVAQPHAEVVLGLLAAARALKDGGWLEDVAAAQGAHLLDAHAADGAPPSWVMGAWKERARFETPCRIGTALDGLAELRGEAKVRQRADQLRRLTWQRYLASRDSLETRERVFLLRWLAPTPGI